MLSALRYVPCCFAIQQCAKNVVALGRYYSTLDKGRGCSSSETARGAPNFVWEKCKQFDVTTLIHTFSKTTIHLVHLDTLQLNTGEGS